MNMLQPTEALEYVREGQGHLQTDYNQKSYRENLMDFVEKGLADQEEAHIAVINGTKKRITVVLDMVQEGWLHDDSGAGKTYEEELEELVNEGHINQEDAHLALHEGKKELAKTFTNFLREAYLAFGEERKFKDSDRDENGIDISGYDGWLNPGKQK